MDEDIFDPMVEALHPQHTTDDTPTTAANNTWKQPEAIFTTSRSSCKSGGSCEETARPDHFTILYNSIKWNYHHPSSAPTVDRQSSKGQTDKDTDV